MEIVNIVLCGLGGQGILFMTRVLALTALDKKLHVIGAETHGMAQRGGSVVSHLRFGEVQGSLVQTGTAGFLLALEEHEGYRNLPFLARNGTMFVNADSQHFPREEVRAFLDSKGIAYHSVAASALARKLGAPRSSNLALLGFFSAFKEAPLEHEEIQHTIDKISPKRVRDINLKVFEAGHKEAEGR